MPSLSPEAPAVRQRAEVLARFFKGLHDPTRVRILLLLVEGEKNVSELVARVGSPQGRVSTHLSCLRWCGYVATRREGRNVYYRLADDRIRALLRLAEAVMAEHARELLCCAVLDRETVADPGADPGPLSVDLGLRAAVET